MRAFVPARIQIFYKALLFGENDCWISDQLIINTQFPHVFLYMVSFFQVEKIFGTFFNIFMPTGSRTNYYPSGFLFVKGFYLFSNTVINIFKLFWQELLSYICLAEAYSFSN